MLCLQAELHTWNVVIRHTRYRDLAKSIWGENAVHLHGSIAPDPFKPLSVQLRCAGASTTQSWTRVCAVSHRT